MMTGRKPNYFLNRERFGCTVKKPGVQNQNRNHMDNRKLGYFSGSLMNQVDPWLPENNTTALSNFGRYICTDPQAQLALASNLLNNLLAPTSHLNELAQPPSLLSLRDTSTCSLSRKSFHSDRFRIPHSNLGRTQRRGDSQRIEMNNRYGDRKNQKKDQINKKDTDQKTPERKEAAEKEGGKLSETSIVLHVSDGTEKKSPNDQPVDIVERNSDSKKTETAESKVSYCEIPPALLFCHICRKHMWDESSFEKHLEGRPHKTMVEELDRSYKLKVALLRHEARVMEQQRENDMKRAHRKSNKAKMQQRGSCTMCDLTFYGTLPAHRKNERHQRLKKFLHPKCNACNKEFYTRLEWDDHKLTTSHLKKLAEKRRPSLNETEFDILDFIEDVNEELEAVSVDIKVCGKRENLDELREDPLTSQIETREKENVEDEEIPTNENGESTKEENVKVEKVDQCDDEEGNEKLPKYVPGIPVGLNFVVEKSGSLCRACNRFILSSKESRTHCQSLIHYNNTIRFLKIQNKIVFSKRRLNDVKNEDEIEINEVREVNSARNEMVYNNEFKRQRLDEVETIILNGSIFGGIPVQEEPFSVDGTEKFKIKNPVFKEKIKIITDEIIEPEPALEGVKKEAIIEISKTAQVSPNVLEENEKTVQPAGFIQRARRTRLN